MPRRKKLPKAVGSGYPDFQRREDRKRMLGGAIRASREERELTQQALGKRVGACKGAIGKYERGEETPPATMIAKIASALDADLRKWLLYAEVQRLARKREDIDGTAMRMWGRIIAQLDEHEHDEDRELGSRSHLDLTRFPRGFDPLVVVVGDRREETPQNLGDLFAFSAACVDDRWLCDLGLPPGTEKITDKVFLFQEPEAEEWRREMFGRKHLLVIGSPAANFLAREINRTCIFRFAVPPLAEKEWRRIKEEEFPALRSPAALEHFKQTNRDLMRGLMRRFQQPGFVAYDTAEEGHKALKVVASIISTRQQDFAVISIGRNPYAKPGDRFFSILVAGIHHPGTAWSVRFLSDPRNFQEHPFGGILEVYFPDRKYDPDKVKWYESIGLGTAFWHTVGQSDLKYNPQTLRKALSDCLQAKIITDAPVDVDELEDNIRLIDLLAEPGEQASSGGDSKATAGNA